MRDKRQATGSKLNTRSVCHRRIVCLAFLLAACRLLLVTSFVWAQAPDPVAEVEATYLRGEYAQVIETGHRVLMAQELSGRHDHLWYLIGMAQLQLRHAVEAQEALQQVVLRFPDSRWRPEAEVGLADAVRVAGDPARAVTLYEELLARWGPGHPAAVRLLYQLGLAAQAAGQWDTARTAFQQVVAHHPQSFEATLARRMLQAGEFAFSVQVGAFGVRGNAARLQRELARRGYSVTVDQSEAEGRPMHRVRVGRFTNREEAAQTARQLKQDGFPAKIVP